MARPKPLADGTPRCHNCTAGLDPKRDRWPDGRWKARCPKCAAHVCAAQKARRIERRATFADPQYALQLDHAGKAEAAARYAHDNHSTRASAAMRFGVELDVVITAWERVYPNVKRQIVSGTVIPWV